MSLPTHEKQKEKGRKDVGGVVCEIERERTEDGKGERERERKGRNGGRVGVGEKNLFQRRQISSLGCGHAK